MRQYNDLRRRVAPYFTDQLASMGTRLPSCVTLSTISARPAMSGHDASMHSHAMVCCRRNRCPFSRHDGAQIVCQSGRELAGRAQAGDQLRWFTLVGRLKLLRTRVRRTWGTGLLSHLSSAVSSFRPAPGTLRECLPPPDVAVTARWEGFLR